MNKLALSFVVCLLGIARGLSQTNQEQPPSQRKSNQPLPRIQSLDGVAAVIGNYVILESDIKRAYLELQSQNIKTENMTDCNILDKLLEEKLYAHQAVQDSIVVSDAELREYVDRQISYSLAQFDNDMDNLLAFYNKTSEAELRNELMEIDRVIQLSQKEQSKITEDIKVTPEEVRQFFKKIPEEDLPFFGTELEISQIVMNPKISQEETDRILNQLYRIKEDVENNNASFASKALLYSEDPGSRSRGGLYSINRKSPMEQAFKDTAFSLNPTEVSEPFETPYGWHIMQLDRIRGNEYDVRHILLIPTASNEAMAECFKNITLLRKRIIDGEISFEDAATQFSDEKETKYNQGKLINPENLTTKFELTKLDPTLNSYIQNLKDGEISAPILDQDQAGRKSYKIIKISNRINGHRASFSTDYDKIQALALKEKKIKFIKKWIADKINYAYIYVNRNYANCQMAHSWLKKQ